MPQSFHLPIGITSGQTAQAARAVNGASPLAGGVSGLAFNAVEVQAGGQRHQLSHQQFRDSHPDIFTKLTAPRHEFAGLPMSEPLVMGILNVTPDSFSDGGDSFTQAAALTRAEAMLKAGAALIDVGGESTRPGATVVPPEEEWQRVAPVIQSLVKQGVKVSLDSRNSLVMKRAIDAGVTIINDVSALNHDPRALEVVARGGVAVILMHMRHDPSTMNRAPFYQDLLPDVVGELAAAVTRAEAAGIKRDNIMIDPGIGFAKNSVHNQSIMANLAGFHGLGLPILLGASRKGLLSGDANRRVEPKQRLGSSLAAALVGLSAGVQMLRVHDVFETCQAVEVWRAIAAR
ncbi:MAG: dihydropteroate synthase [Candidatus Pacebacteria bacterium]|nr:dihydropteroate synthase [Candidatus Paceibacterota bacterium]